MSTSASKRSRLIVDVSPELRRRIKIAAAKRDISVRDYVVDILEQTVPTGDRIEATYEGPVTPAYVERLRRTRAAIMRGRHFTEDSADLINEARVERTAEL